MLKLVQERKLWAWLEADPELCRHCHHQSIIADKIASRPVMSLRTTLSRIRCGVVEVAVWSD